MYVCMCECVRVCMCVCLGVFMYVCVCVFVVCEKINVIGFLNECIAIFNLLFFLNFRFYSIAITTRHAYSSAAANVFSWVP